MPKIAVLTGATGLVGRHLTEQLQETGRYDEIVVITRRETGFKGKGIREIILPLDKMNIIDEDWHSGHLYCCLGTTMKKAGSKEGFRKVDYDAVLDFARLGLKNGGTAFSLVSATGASSDSIFFYNRVKGETEEELLKLGYDTTIIVRPSMILGDRKESRLGETIGKWVLKVFSPVLFGKLKRYRGVHASDIANVMIREMNRIEKGNLIIQSENI